WINRTIIGFYLPEATEATLNVYDETGRLLYNQTGDFAKGHNAFILDKALVNTTGVLYYQVSTSEESVTMKMIQTK
ncbi:MAG: T9SS type A sorting domain-containing protein, partial [Saprospiraceae bacterium]|nr:T9SS type A sorting domain-containing protein [Saprospiraceae bacterium]